MCAMTQSQVWKDSVMCAPWLSKICDGTHDSVARVTGLFCRDTGLFCGDIGLFCGDIGLFCGDIRLFCSDAGFFGRNVMIYLSTMIAWLSHACDKTHSYVNNIWHDKFICVNIMYFLIYIWWCNEATACVRHESAQYVRWHQIYNWKYIIFTHMNLSCHMLFTYEWVLSHNM